MKSIGNLKCVLITTNNINNRHCQRKNSGLLFDFQMQKAYINREEHRVNISLVYRECAIIMLSTGHLDLTDKKPRGCPSSKTTDDKIERVEGLIVADWRLIFLEIADFLFISQHI